MAIEDLFKACLSESIVKAKSKRNKPKSKPHLKIVPTSKAPNARTIRTPR